MEEQNAHRKRQLEKADLAATLIAMIVLIAICSLIALVVTNPDWFRGGR